MDDRLADANEIWRIASERNFFRADLRRVGFRPKRVDAPVWIGRVTQVGLGFAFTPVERYGEFFIPAYPAQPK